jgi:hypothetical protein
MEVYLLGAVIGIALGLAILGMIQFIVTASTEG